MFKYRLPKTATAPFCPSQIHSTVAVPPGASTWLRFKRYSGIGLLISVGYMDPGNWATDLEAGSTFGYGLLFVVLLSSLVAMVLQTLCVRLGVATGKDLAACCRERFPPALNSALWLAAEVAIIACDIAEVLGTALALKLLLGLPLGIGILLTALDTVIVLVLQGKGVLTVEAIVTGLVGTIAAAFFIEILLSQPVWGDVVKGLVPDAQLLLNHESMFIAIGILGATVMPHNLYLHSSAVGTRTIAHTDSAKSDAIMLMNADVLLSLTLAFFINAAILVLASSAFHMSGFTNITDIGDAHTLLKPLLGTAAPILFALALLASGQSSTLTGTIAGQVILEGFLDLHIPCWQRRLITRTLAIIPAWIGVMMLGDGGLSQLLVLSQIILSMQLPFAVVPLILFCSNREMMQQWKLSCLMQIVCWGIAASIILANGILLYQTFF
ncbi:MAG: Nramp family divalent metal transporter [Alphaproteobacteria bacterium]|nr:Nramp family divalent metal transporter [Alphaproteobacteria bacterium]